MKDYLERDIKIGDTVIFGTMLISNSAGRDLTEGTVEGFRNDGRLKVVGPNKWPWVRHPGYYFPFPKEVIIKQ